MARALDCRAKHRWFEPNPRIIVGMLAHCSPSSKWVPGGNTGEVKGGEERNWPPYLTMPAAQDKCLSNGHSPNVRSRTRDSPLPHLTTKAYFAIGINNIDEHGILLNFIHLIYTLQYNIKPHHFVSFHFQIR